MCKTQLCIKYGFGFNYIYNFSLLYSLHSETFKSWILNKIFNANIIENQYYLFELE